ncbi:hypothetical protein IGI37_001995 [Enterococcus sp. AZ194]|uniref:hypothetical protein n=1 Tax=Enterococcus sp. AZ194 TaxID=2774629 RepID=UPI003F24BDFD
MKKITLGLIILFSAVSLVGCGNDSKTESKISSQDTTISSTSEELKEENSIETAETSSNIEDYILSTAQEVPLGEGVIFDSGHEVYVKSIKITDEEPNITETIKNNFVRVDFSFKNGETKAITFAGPNVKMYNSDGTEAKLSSKNFIYEEIESGETKQFSAYFDAKDGPYKVAVGRFYWESK